MKNIKKFIVIMAMTMIFSVSAFLPKVKKTLNGKAE